MNWFTEELKRVDFGHYPFTPFSIWEEYYLKPQSSFLLILCLSSDIISGKPNGHIYKANTCCWSGVQKWPISPILGTIKELPWKFKTVTFKHFCHHHCHQVQFTKNLMNFLGQSSRVIWSLKMFYIPHFRHKKNFPKKIEH